MSPLLTSSEAARACYVDLKTIYNWTELGRIPAAIWFRTPGRHLRFHADLFAEWLAQRGFQVPPDVAEGARLAREMRAATRAA